MVSRLIHPNPQGCFFNFGHLVVYEGGAKRTVNISVEYQRVIEAPSGRFTAHLQAWQGAGITVIPIDIIMGKSPTTGAYRFRARRTNDNGDAANLSDETKFYQAYAFHRLAKLVYDNRVLVRTPEPLQQWTQQAENRVNWTVLLKALVYTYVAVWSLQTVCHRAIWPDLTIDLALHPRLVDVQNLKLILIESIKREMKSWIFRFWKKWPSLITRLITQYVIWRNDANDCNGDLLTW